MFYWLVCLDSSRIILFESLVWDMGRDLPNGMDPLNLMYQQFARDWSLLGTIRANSKGASYEEALTKFLSKYFGGIYDIRQRGAIIDPNLDCFDTFEYNGDEEIDVVGIFRRSSPKFVFEYTTMDTHEGSIESNPSLKWIPGEAVAFICEVKSRLTTTSLRDDLDKISKVAYLDDSLQGRFNSVFTSQFSIREPLRCLVYNRSNISEESLSDILVDNDDWHLLLSVMDDSLVINNSLPIYDYFNPTSDNFGPENLSLPTEAAEWLSPYASDSDFLILDRGVFWFFVSMSVSIPKPIQISSINSLLALSQSPAITYSDSI